MLQTLENIAIAKPGKPFGSAHFPTCRQATTLVLLIFQNTTRKAIWSCLCFKTSMLKPILVLPVFPSIIKETLGPWPCFQLPP